MSAGASATGPRTSCRSRTGASTLATSGSALTIEGKRSYLGATLLVLLAGCGKHVQPVAPLSFAASTRAAFLEAAEATLPTERQILRIGWRSDDGHLQVSGGGAVRIAPPDSLRLDVAA